MRIRLRKLKLTDLLRLMNLSKNKEVSKNLEHSNFGYFVREVWKFLTFNLPIRRVILYKNQVVGIVNLTKPKNHASEIGYFVGKEYQNKGIATEAVRRMVQFGFFKLKLDKIYAYCNYSNIASQKVLIKNSFNKKKNTKDKKFYFEKKA